MRFEENPYYEQWRDAVISVAKAQWALDVGQASHLDVELATARYDRLDALLHGGAGDAALGESDQPLQAG